MYNYEKFKRDFRLILIGSHAWHACVEIKNADNFYPVTNKIALVFETMSCQIELRVKSHRGELVDFSFRAALWFRQ